MALAFILVGLAIIVVAIRNTYADLGSALAQDMFTGQFWEWIVALLIIAAIGYVPYLRTPSRWLLALLIVVFIIANGSGFFSKLQSAGAAKPTSGTQTAADTAANPTIGEALPVQLNISGSGGIGGLLGSIGKLATSVGGMTATGGL